MIESAQLALPIPEPAKAPEAELLRQLLAHGTWMKQGELCRAARFKGLEWDHYDVNKAGQALSPEVISGERGYKLTRHATAEEVDHFCNQMIARGRAMVERAERTRRFAHGIFG